MNDPLLTIVTLTKDAPEAVGRTLASTSALRAAGVQHVVVDGGWDALASPPSGVEWLRREPRGVADGFNHGLGAARGDWVWFLNGGDEADSALDARWLLELLDRTRADVVIGATTYRGEARPRPHFAPARAWPPVAPWIPHPSTLVRRGLFSRFGGFDQRYRIVMDYEWWLRVLTRPDVTIDVVSVPLAVFEGGGLSGQTSPGGRLARERDDALRRWQGRLWRGWLASGARLARASVRAWGARRLGKGGAD